jgi:hypothetical protein
MASIRTTVADNRYYVSVRGLLLDNEVRLLERACGPALEQRELRLTVDLDDTRVPPAACVFLRRLQARGASVVGPGGDTVLNFPRPW